MNFKHILFILFLIGENLLGQIQKPNIVFIMTDDQSSIPLRSSDNQNQSRPFGFNGDSKVHTPIIDDLASNGLVFNNAFVSSSICSPSRYTVLTGKYAGRSEGTSFVNNFPLGNLSRVANNIELEENKTNLPKQLQAAGYKTAFIGKSHIIDHTVLENYTQGNNGFMAYSKTADPYTSSVSDAMKFNHDRWADRVKSFGFDVVDAFYAANLRELKNDVLNIHNVEYKNKAVLDFIDTSGEDPFFVYYSETIPHGPAPYWKKNGEYYAGLDADVNITSEGVLTQDYSYLPSRDQIKSEINGIEGKDPRHAWLRWFDHAVGAVVDKLREKGKLENTLLIITSDHGDLNHGKATNYEGGIKVPLMMYWKNGIATTGTYDELVQNIDFAPTFLDIAGVDISNSEIDGKSLKEVITNNSKAPVHDHLFFELGYSRAIRTKEWKYVAVRYPDAINTKIENGDTFNGINGTQVSFPYYIPNASLGGLAAAQYPLYSEKDQLFDLKNDSYETTNLFNTQPEKATELRNALRTELLSFPSRPYQEFTDTTLDLSVSTKNTSILGKVLAGYQGWFNTPTDGSNRGWNHYNTSSGGFEPGEVTIDFWPDMSETDADEKYATPFNYTDGSIAHVFSSTNIKTVNRHFKWMDDYGIDGVFFQQFANPLKSPNVKANDIIVFDNVINASIANNNRLVSIMYDLSGSNATGTMVDDIKQHWQEMADKHGVNDSTKEYVLTYQQKPVVALWGVGFNRTDSYDLEDVEELIDYFKNDGCAVLLGVPRSWRTPGEGDAVDDAQLLDVIKSADIVHPWTVGRYNDIDGIDSHKSTLIGDKAWCDAENLLYMPVVFPGFSWQNLKKSQGTNSELNSIPRLKGDFLWRQFYNVIDAGLQTAYVAMFDEMDEGTCIFKVENNPPSSAESQFANYEGLPSDYYLWLTGKAGEALRGEINLTSNQPTYTDLPGNGGNTNPGTIYVSATGAGAMDGTSEANAYGNFGTAMAAIDSEGDKLIIIGAIAPDGTNLNSKSFAFTIEGLDASSTITGDGGTGRLFTINGATSADVTFKNLTFLNNSTTLAGGAVLFNNNAGAKVTFDNCNFTGNTVANAAGGGALFFANGELNIIDSSFENNTSIDEAGAINGVSGTITITNTLFKSNSAATKGGAIYSSNANFTITGSTFYDNATTNTSGQTGGAAFYVAGVNSTNSITNCTFFENTIALPNNQDYGAIRTDNGNTTVTNSLFYDNKTNNGDGAPSDWGSGPNGTQTFNTSIAQWISTNVDNQDEGAGSITGLKGGGGTPANLASSNLTFNATSGYVEYNNVEEGTDSPIDFGSDGNDVGAWDSGLTLSIDEVLKSKVSVSMNNDSKTIEINHDLDQSLSIKLFSILGSRVMDVKNVSKTARLSADQLKTGVYILIGKSSGKYFSKKLIIN